jgi:acetyl esterase/lipase
MLNERIYLNESDDRIYIDTYVQDEQPNYCAAHVRDAILIIPGGAYAYVCGALEGESIALAFATLGYNAFVLHYGVGEERDVFPKQLLDAGRAMLYIRNNAEKYRINPERVFAVGFSAGGHLCADLAVEHQNISEMAGVAVDAKPTAVGLSYPVITKKHGHFASYDNLLNGYSEEEKAALTEKLSLNEMVTEQTTPAFLWTTATDQVVPADNAIRFALALADKGIDYELHVYPHGVHGLSTVRLDVNQAQPHIERATRWVDDCAAFFRLYCVETF